MQSILLRLSHVLLIISLLYSTEGTEKGCAYWTPDGDNVICSKCRPGNRMVMTSGPDPAELCVPCTSREYITDPRAAFCKRCRECLDPQIELQACTTTSDTVCGCKKGLRCGDEACTYCVDECEKGQEPTILRDCQKCRPGTFNDQIHSNCKPWRKSCPEGEIMVAEGNEFSDIKCSHVPTKAFTPIPNLYTVRPVRKPEDDPTWLLFGILGGVFAFIVTVYLSVLTYHRMKNKTETKDTISEEEPRFVMVQPDDACSFHQPEQEQGDSMESISTLDSDSKLIV